MIWLYVKSTKLCDICFLPQTPSFLTESRQRPATSRLSGRLVSGPQDHHQSSSDRRMRIRSPGFSVLYWVLTQTQEIGLICLAGIAPAHISPLSEFSQGISPGSPIKGLPICGNWCHPATDWRWHQMLWLYLHLSLWFIQLWDYQLFKNNWRSIKKLISYQIIDKSE